MIGYVPHLPLKKNSLTSNGSFSWSAMGFLTQSSSRKQEWWTSAPCWSNHSWGGQGTRLKPPTHTCQRSCYMWTEGQPVSPTVGRGKAKRTPSRSPSRSAALILKPGKRPPHGVAWQDTEASACEDCRISQDVQKRQQQKCQASNTGPSDQPLAFSCMQCNRFFVVQITHTATHTHITPPDNNELRSWLSFTMKDEHHQPHCRGF